MIAERVPLVRQPRFSLAHRKLFYQVNASLVYSVVPIVRYYPCERIVNLGYRDIGLPKSWGCSCLNAASALGLYTLYPAIALSRLLAPSDFVWMINDDVSDIPSCWMSMHQVCAASRKDLSPHSTSVRWHGLYSHWVRVMSHCVCWEIKFCTSKSHITFHNLNSEWLNFFHLFVHTLANKHDTRMTLFVKCWMAYVDTVMDVHPCDKRVLNVGTCLVGLLYEIDHNQCPRPYQSCLHKFNAEVIIILCDNFHRCRSFKSPQKPKEQGDCWMFHKIGCWWCVGSARLWWVTCPMISRHWVCSTSCFKTMVGTPVLYASSV